MIECIRWWMAHHPELVQGWAVLAVIDITLLVIASFMKDEERGIESAVGVVDDIRMEL